MVLNEATITARPPGGTHGGGPFNDLAPIMNGLVVRPGRSYLLKATRKFKRTDKTGVWEIYATYQSPDGGWHDGPSGSVVVK